MQVYGRRNAHLWPRAQRAAAKMQALACGLSARQSLLSGRFLEGGHLEPQDAQGEQ